MNEPLEHAVDATAVRRGHELRETNVGFIVKFGVGLVALAVISMLLMWGFFVLLKDYNIARFQKASPLIESDQLPPAPRLQVIPEEDLAAMRAAERKKLETYGWVIRTAKIVRVPIERAMELTAEKGLPVRDQTPPSETK